MLVYNSVNENLTISQKNVSFTVLPVETNSLGIFPFLSKNVTSIVFILDLYKQQQIPKLRSLIAEEAAVYYRMG